MIYKGSLFKNRKFKSELLKKFGFKAKGEIFLYNTKILDNSFDLTITVSNDDSVDTKLIELATQDEYSLVYAIGAQGEFVGTVRAALDEVLLKIKNECTALDVFKTKYALEIIDFIKQKFNDEPEYLWEKFPNNAVFRKKDNSKTGGKWYAAILTAKRKSVGLSGTGEIEVIDLKAEPEDIDNIVDNKRFFRGYHMNKKHWFTIPLDGTVDIEEIKAKIIQSRNLL